MISLSAAWEAMPLSLVHKPSISTALQRIRARIVALLPIVAWMSIAAAMVFFVLATIHTASPAKKPSSHTKANAVVIVPNTTTKKASNCAAQTNTAVFATCPTFTQDYTAQTNGIVSPQVFNVATGKPEANQEAQLYTANTQNLRIQNGSLVLQALNDPQQGFNYTSARIDTKGKEDFLYGKLVIRATLPTGIGTWPAIWMLPSQSKYAALSPVTDVNRYLNDGEIDIAESVGTQPHQIYGIAHSLAYPEDGPNRSYYNVVKVPDNNTVFHDYEIDWTPTNLTFSVDGQAYFSISKQAGADYHSWPYDQPFYLIINLAIGGSWGGTDRAQFPLDGVDTSALPASLNVQSIHYYPYIGQ